MNLLGKPRGWLVPILWFGWGALYSTTVFYKEMRESEEKLMIDEYRDPFSEVGWQFMRGWLAGRERSVGNLREAGFQ